MSRKTYDGSVFMAEDEELDEGETAFQVTGMDEWEDEAMDALVAEGDDDALMVQDFEIAATEVLQGDAELASAFTAYTDARRRLSEKARFRGFWPVQKHNFNKGKRKDGKSFGKGKSSGKKTLQQKILNSHCRLCGQKGHWRAECPQRQSTGQSSAPSTNTGAFTGMSMAEAEEETLPMEFVNLPEEFKPSESHDKEPRSASDCFTSIGDSLWGKHSARERIRSTMLRWGVAKPRATGFWESTNSRNSRVTNEELQTTEPSLRHRDKKGESRAQNTAQAKTCASLETAALSVGSQSPGSDSMGADGILDTGATKTVIGSQLIASFLDALSPKLRARVTRGPCNVLFRFGNQGTLMSKHAMHVPIGPLVLRIAVVPGRTPLLLSNTLMRVLKASINMESHQLISPHARQPVPLKLSPKGLYLMNVDDLAKSVHGDRLHESTTFLAETDAIEQKPSRCESTQAQQPGSSRSVKPEPNGEPSAAHERPQAEPRGDGRGEHVAGGAGQDQSEDRQDLQRIHLRRDVEEPQELGQMDDQVVREQRQATTQDAQTLCAVEAGPGRDEPTHLPTERNGQGQEQELPSRQLSVLGGDRERNQDRDGGRDGCMGDGRGRGDVERDRAHPERSGAAGGPHGQHGEHDLPGPHADCVLATSHESSAVTRCLEQLKRWEPEEAILFAGDIAAHACESHPEISGHDQQLMQRLIYSYEQEIRQMQATVHRPGQQTMFLFEVFCHAQSQIGQQCQAAQVPFQRFTRERGDLETRAGRLDLFRELVRHRPLHVWFAPTCTVWSGWAELNGSKSREAYEQLTERRIQMLRQVALGITILRFQMASGKHMHWEQPRKSLMNRLACLRELRQLCHQSNFDMCVIGHLECPQTGLPMKKSTTVFTTSQPLHKRLHGQVCTKHIEHQAIEGSIVVNGERVNRSRYSENCTRRFARQVIRALMSADSRAFAAEGEVGSPAAKSI